MFKGFGIVAIIAFAILLLVLGPIAVIWSVNTLFPVAAIPYTFDTWVAVVLLGAFFRGNVTVKKD